MISQRELTVYAVIKEKPPVLENKQGLVLLVAFEGWSTARAPGSDMEGGLSQFLHYAKQLGNSQIPGFNEDFTSL